MMGHSRREKREAKDCDQISLLLPIDPVCRLLRPGICAEPVCADVQVNLFAVLEYLATEMLEMAINVVGVDKEMRIIPVSATSLSTDLSHRQPTTYALSPAFLFVKMCSLLPQIFIFSETISRESIR